MRISLFMKTVHTLSLRRTTSDICSPSPSQRKDSAHLLFYVIGSLSSYSLREATCIFLIGRDFFERLRPGPRNDWNIRSITKPRKAGIASSLILLSEERRFHARISRTPTNQQDSFKSARSSRISKILSNRQDFSESARLLESDGYSPTAFHHRAIALHSLPQLEGLSLVVFSIFKRLSGLLRVRGLLIVRAQSPYLVIAV